MSIRVPQLTDLSEPNQVQALLTVLQEIRNDLSRTAMPNEKAGGKQEAQAQESRFRVVDREVAPSDSTYDQERSQEVHFYVGKRWMRVTLEEID